MIKLVYVKHREVKKSFNFSTEITNGDLPRYIRHYIYENETILAAYKTSRDHGIFTLNKIVLFDNVDACKQMYTISYLSISTIFISFNEMEVEMSIVLDSGYPIRLNFVKIKYDLDFYIHALIAL